MFGGASATATGSYPSPSSLAIIVLVAILSYFIATTFFHGRYTVPLPSYKSGFQVQEAFTEEEPEAEPEAEEEDQGITEAFAIPQPTLIPPPKTCTNLLGQTILASFSSRRSTTGEGRRDYVEISHMINKLSCFQQDLTSGEFTVSATLKQPFITTHDVEPISETTGRCFAKTLPPRDLDIQMDKWTERGNMLIRRLCTSYSLTNAEVEEVEKNFQTFIRDIYDTTRNNCLQKEPLDVSARGPRDPAPSSTHLKTAEYTGYY